MSRLQNQTLVDMIKGIRAHPTTEESYVGHAVDSIRAELKASKTIDYVNSVQKLAYLHLIGYNQSWASFYVVQLMAQPKFHLKRTGYLVASQLFDEENDCIMLATQTMKKDFSGRTQYEVGMALNCVSNLCNVELAENTVSDIVALLGHSLPYVRKRAVATLYRILLKLPTSLRAVFPRLKEKLEDNDSGVQACTVNVFCELATKNPKNVLELAPQFYKMLNETNQVWMQIKLVKILGALFPLEPRLPKKMADIILNIIQTTQAYSLRFECIRAAIVACEDVPAFIPSCVEHLGKFIQDEDANLKYLGLWALRQIMDIQPKAVMEHRYTILNCLKDTDTTIRLRSLDIIGSMISSRNFEEIAGHLLEVMETTVCEPVFKQAVVDCILTAARDDNYSKVPDFDWLIDLVLKMSLLGGVGNGSEMGAALLDIMPRVKAVRESGVAAMIEYISKVSMDMVAHGGLTNTKGKDFPSAVIQACAWSIGEYCSFVEEPSTTVLLLIHPGWLSLPSATQSSLIWAAFKIIAKDSTILDQEEVPKAVGRILKNPILAAIIPQSFKDAHAHTMDLDDSVEEEEEIVLNPSDISDVSDTDTSSDSSSDSDSSDSSSSDSEEREEKKQRKLERLEAKRAAKLKTRIEELKKKRLAEREAKTFEERVMRALLEYSRSSNIEVQERAWLVFTLLAEHVEQEEVQTIFQEELKAVNKDAQSKIPVIPGLDLDAVIDPVFETEVVEPETEFGFFFHRRQKLAVPTYDADLSFFDRRDKKAKKDKKRKRRKDDSTSSETDSMPMPSKKEQNMLFILGMDGGKKDKKDKKKKTKKGLDSSDSESGKKKNKRKKQQHFAIEDLDDVEGDLPTKPNQVKEKKIDLSAIDIHAEGDWMEELPTVKPYAYLGSSSTPAQTASPSTKKGEKAPPPKPSNAGNMFYIAPSAAEKKEKDKKERKKKHEKKKAVVESSDDGEEEKPKKKKSKGSKKDTDDLIAAIEAQDEIHIAHTGGDEPEKKKKKKKHDDGEEEKPKKKKKRVDSDNEEEEKPKKKKKRDADDSDDDGKKKKRKRDAEDDDEGEKKKKKKHKKHSDD